MRALVARAMRSLADRLDPLPPPETPPVYWPTWPGYLSGYSCPSCYGWVPFGVPHHCNGVVVTYTNTAGWVDA